MKTVIIFTMSFFLLLQVKAQDIFISKGKIEFEKKYSLHKSVEEMAEGEYYEKDYAEYIKKNYPATLSTYFDMYFDDGKTLYKPGREPDGNQRTPDWLLPPAKDNIVYTDLDKQQSTSIKNVYDNSFLIQDSTRKIDWRITMDTRTIAGFECQKAVGKIMDSVYVIAFYTDEILTQGGPESFNGLPGMILGIAIPRIHTTWFATKLELIPVKPEDIVAPKKGEKSRQQRFADTVKGCNERLE